MMRTSTLFVVAVAVTAGCSDDTNYPKNSCSGVSGTCIQIDGGDTAKLDTAANSLEADTTLVLGAGTFAMTNSLTIRTKGAHIIGQGADATILDYGGVTAHNPFH